jgi:hypothetical protein
MSTFRVAPGRTELATGLSRRTKADIAPVAGFLSSVGERGRLEDCRAGARYAGVSWWKRSCHEEPARTQIELRLPTAICWWRT